MRIKFGLLINTDAELQSLATNLDGQLVLTLKVKGQTGTIIMSAAEGLKLFKDLKAADVEGLASIYA